DPGPLEDPELGGVPVEDAVLELLLDGQVSLAVGLDQRHLVALVDQLAGEVPADLATADDQHVIAALALTHPAGPPCSPRPRGGSSRASRSRSASGRPSSSPGSRTTRPGTGRGS